MVVWGGIEAGGFGRDPYISVAIYSCSHAIAGAVTGFVAVATLAATSNQPSSIYWQLRSRPLRPKSAETDVLFASARCGCEGRRHGRCSLAARARGLCVCLLYAPLVGLLVIAYEEISPVTLLLFLVPALAAQRLFGLYQEQLQLTEKLAVPTFASSE